MEAVIVRSNVAAGDVAPIEEGPLVVDLLGDDRRVRWVGQPIAVVGAETLTEARRVAEEFPLEIAELPFVLDPDEAQADDAPLVYEGRKARRNAVSSAEAMTTPGRWHGNRRGPLGLGLLGGVAKRRVRQAREENDAGLVEIDFETAAQLHCSLEPHCTVADFSDPDRLEVWTSTQALSAVAKELGEHYHLDEHDVVVNAEFVGGGFGSKLVGRGGPDRHHRSVRPQPEDRPSGPGDPGPQDRAHRPPVTGPPLGARCRSWPTPTVS